MFGDREQLPDHFGPFLLLRLLGVGGMGRAYLATHPEWPTELVVKRMHRHYMDDEEIFKRFIHEAKVATYVRQENVAQLVAMGTIGEEPFIATEFVFGIAVSTIVERVESSKTAPIPYPVAVRLATGLARGVEAIHDARDIGTGEALNLLHRDIGSRNVLIGFDGRVRIIDLGLGKSTLADWNTAADTFAGSPDYMPPEQALGQRVDRHADVYSTAVTIWELLVGQKRIREVSVAARIRAAIDRQPEPLCVHRPEASTHMEAALMGAMERRPDERTPTMRILIEALETEQARVGGRPPRMEVVDWLDAACATIIAKERRTLDDAREAASTIARPTQPMEGTQFLAAQPILFMPPLAPRKESSIVEAPPTDSFATGIAKVLDSTRTIQARTVVEVRQLTRWYRRQTVGARFALNALPAVIIVLLVAIIVSGRMRPSGGTPLVVTTPALPAPVRVAVEPARAAGRAVDPGPAVDEPRAARGETETETETNPSATRSGRSADDAAVGASPSAAAERRGTGSFSRRIRLPPERLARKKNLVARIRVLRKKSFDVTWQRKLTRLGRQLSRARTKAAFDRVEGQIKRMERDL